MMNPASLIKNPLANLGFTLGLEKEGDYKYWKFTFCLPKDCLYKGEFIVYQLISLIIFQMPLQIYVLILQFII